MAVDRKLARNADFLLVAAVIVLVAFGLVAIYSATQNLAEAQDDPLYFVKRQAAGFGFGVLALLVVLALDYRDLEKLAGFLYVLGLLLLGAVLWTGPTIGGAARWLVLGPVRLQPSELAKLVAIISLARLLAQRGEVESWRGLLLPFLHLAPLMLLIMLQPDLGTALVFGGIALGMLFMAGADLRRMGGLLALGGALGGVLVWASRAAGFPLLKDYQIQRLLVFIDPYKYRHEEGWNVIQSMIAIGSGGLFGKGLFGGSQTQLSFLPARHTDFIFSVVGEEFGFLGALSVLLVYFVLLWRILLAVTQAKDAFGGLLVAGVGSMVAVHLLVNVGMTLGVMPVTGLPLPFLSYGGSSLLTNLVGIGLVLNVAIRRQKIRF